MGKYYNKTILCGDEALSLEDIEGFIHLAMVKGWVNTLGNLEFMRTRDYNARTSLGIETSLAMVAVYKASRKSEMSGILQHLFNHCDEESFLGAKFAWMLNLCRQKRRQMNVTEYSHQVAWSHSNYRMLGWWHLLGPYYSKLTKVVFTNAAKHILQSLGNLYWLSFIQDSALKVYGKSSVLGARPSDGGPANAPCDGWRLWCFSKLWKYVFSFDWRYVALTVML